MMGSRALHPRILGAGKFLARLLRAVATALEGHSAGQSGSDDRYEGMMTMLRRRYPDAPEHWLHFIAERTPAPETTEPGPAERSGLHGGRDMRGRSEAAHSWRKRLLSFGRVEEAAREEQAGRRPDAPTAQNADDGGEMGARPQCYSARTLSGPPQTGGGRNAIETSTSLPEPTLRPIPPASQISFVGPRFRPRPSPQQQRMARDGSVSDAPSRLPRIVTSFAFPDRAGRSDSHREASWVSDKPERRLAPHVEPVVAPERAASPSASMPDKEFHAVAYGGRTQVQSVFAASGASQNNKADKNRNVSALHTAVADCRSSYRNRSAGLSIVLPSTEQRRDVVFAPDEPKWPKLPIGPQISPDREPAQSARITNEPEESDRWNELPF